MRVRTAIVALLLCASVASAGLLSQLLAAAGAARKGGAAQPTTSGLIALWTFDGHAVDYVGNHTGTVENAVLTNGIMGVTNTAYYFNGTSARISVPYQDFNWAKTQPWTVSAWIKFESAANDVGYVFAHYFLNPGGWYCATYKATNVYQQLQSSGSNYKYHGGDAPAVGGWSHVVWVNDGSATTNGMLTYRDGVLRRATHSGEGGTLGDIRHTNPAYFGYGWNGSVHQYYKGAIDQVRVYTNALSSNDVWTIYQAEKP